MKCLHCLVDFHPAEKIIEVGKDREYIWYVSTYECPACKRLNIFLNFSTEHPLPPNSKRQSQGQIAVWPRAGNRPPCPPEVPADLAEDYKEACIVLPDSAKASAALSRRCLQNLLRQAAKVKPGDLATEIQQAIDSGIMPSHLVEVIDAVRQIGNFAAHPMKSKNTGEILPVETQEAEWNLDVLEALFDFFYVQPAVIAKKKVQLNAKLQEAGKPPMK